MVDGLEHFLTHFQGFESHFILIGGTACDLWMGNVGLEFRATKDLDIVLIAESLPAEFFERFWAFIREGQYESLERSETRPSFYRFKNPKDARHPLMIELFSRNFLQIPDGYHLTPIPAGEDISSLSAILLGDDYFGYIASSRITIDGVPTIPVQCLIPLKARAYLDLVARKDSGEQIDSRKITKHRNDVFRLYRTLVPDARFVLPIPLREDLSRFLDSLPPALREWKDILDAVKELPKPEQVIAQIRENFGIGGAVDSGQSRGQTTFCFLRGNRWQIGGTAGVAWQLKGVPPFAFLVRPKNAPE